MGQRSKKMQEIHDLACDIALFINDNIFRNYEKINKKEDADFLFKLIRKDITRIKKGYLKANKQIKRRKDCMKK